MRLILYILFGVGGVLVALALGIVFFADDETAEIAPQTKSIEAIPSPPKAVAPNAEIQLADQAQSEASSNLSVQPDADAGLSIDVARVKPDGSAVLAGTGPAGATITVFEDEILLGKTTASENGEWVVVLEKRLGPGQHLLSVGAELEDGSTIIAQFSIAVEIYEDQNTKPLVALLPENQSEIPKLLQSPDDAGDTKEDTTAPTTVLALIAPRGLIWQDNALLTVSGHSRGGVRVTVSDSGTNFGDALVLADGTWQVTGTVEKNRRQHVFEFVLVDNGGQAVASYILPVRPRDLQKGLDGSQLVIVNKGDALWRIAYRSYGRGVRYVDIVRKNTGDIRNPDLIYPNQIFALPKTVPEN